MCVCVCVPARALPVSDTSTRLNPFVGGFNNVLHVLVWDADGGCRVSHTDRSCLEHPSALLLLLLRLGHSIYSSPERQGSGALTSEEHWAALEALS